MKRVHLLFEHDLSGRPYGCFFIRLLRPLTHVAVNGQFDLTYGLELPQTPVDIVVVERGWRPDISLDGAKKLVREIKGCGAKLVYTFDDNLVDLHELAPWETYPGTEQRMIFRYLMRQADGLIVSTAPLKARFSSLNANIRVVPNALDEGLFGGVPERSDQSAKDRVVLGYMGTRTHTADLLMILTPLREFLHRNRDRVVLELVGVYADHRIEKCFSGYPVRFLDVGAAVDYEKFVPWARKNLAWDFALAPLEDTHFNRYKSDIKFLDYSMLGIPGIFSNVESYRNTVRHRETGWLCENDCDAWLEALESMLGDEHLRKSLAVNSAEFVRARRSLKQHAVDWVDAIKEIAG